MTKTSPEVQKELVIASLCVEGERWQNARSDIEAAQLMTRVNTLLEELFGYMVECGEV